MASDLCLRLQSAACHPNQVVQNCITTAPTTRLELLSSNQVEAVGLFLLWRKRVITHAIGGDANPHGTAHHGRVEHSAVAGHGGIGR